MTDGLDVQHETKRNQEYFHCFLFNNRVKWGIDPLYVRSSVFNKNRQEKKKMIK